ncbi:hypothetical protein [Sphingomonas sp. CFBP 13720]|uniref:hypothetical protein n=1 Tax=Sphingomonas sp. CFBP 13720 TaxID=2775302 RepID=UPI001784270C|nr:hypothetical protein [Sphingomonas sp. CFBP 13720]MBD8678388.1 hypothetical protein [Sphingomonas sp. CFBP 13720]
MVNFASWSAAVVASGALVIAALLFVLQRLRVQRRRVALAAAPLWSQAARAAPPRVLGGRFRRPLSFVLALAIALALWLAASRPESTAPPAGGVHLFYLDASALMTGDGAFARARTDLVRQASAVPPRARRVVLGDPSATTLLAAGEDGALLPARLDGVRPGLYPSAFARWLAQRDPATPVTIHYFGHRAVFDAARRANGRVRLVPGFLADPVAANRGIVELGVSPAASGAWDRADVFVAITDSAARAPRPDDLRLRLGDAALSPARIEAAGDGRFVVRDVPATGKALEVALQRGDDFTADDRASILIPDLRPVRVAIGAGVPATIERVLRLDPAFRIVTADAAQVVVRLAGTPGDRLPSLILTDPVAEPATFVVTSPAGDGDVALADRMDSLGLRGIDAGVLADDLGRSVALREGTPTTVRSVSAWRSLFDGRTAFARSSTLPLFVSQTLRWLARPTPWVPYAKAGEPLVDQSALDGLADDPALREQGLGDGVYLPEAGRTVIAGREVRVALADRETSRLAAARPAAASPVADVSSGSLIDLLFPALLLVAFTLLAFEWRLFQRGWMP